ncbi:hypothetical protein NUU61_000069 [Penicillium alfredii]|uniref:Uncharacterized protein n=1 Tax=Penicillium alfredii TaxID=1506179 RepID=A0A9W9G8V4_9EURO|nr:uncharacterized protein NUU61_000069 [Penicillium alfredii]KAJ5114310.1 hypothetical protein NUU61_000069 [Penicillium alfredii]
MHNRSNRLRGGRSNPSNYRGRYWHQRNYAQTNQSTWNTNTSNAYSQANVLQLHPSVPQRSLPTINDRGSPIPNRTSWLANTEYPSAEDRMDIDSNDDPVPAVNTVTRPSEMPPPVTPPNPRSGIYRHVFCLDIGHRGGCNTDYDILGAARVQLDRLQKSGSLENPVPVNLRRLRVHVAIDTRSSSREDALVNANLRLFLMQDMINDGLGWFTGLPWRHEHFVVELLRPQY